LGGPEVKPCVVHTTSKINLEPHARFPATMLRVTGYNFPPRFPMRGVSPPIRNKTNVFSTN